MRVAALIQASLLSTMGILVLVRAGLFFPDWLETSHSLIWGVVAISTASLAMNMITPVRLERLLWAPVGAALTVSSLMVALSN